MASGRLRQLLATAPEPALMMDTGPGLFTIGYQGYSQREYLKALGARSVTVLCDLRRTAGSRDAGFARLALRSACTAEGIRYEHLWQLGAHSERRRARWRQKRQDLLLEDYRIRSLPNQQTLLEAIHSLLLNGERVALTCFEHHADECHRSAVADYLHRAYGQLCAPTHL